MNEKRYSKLALERIAIGELDRPMSSRSSELISSAIDEINASNKEILDKYPPSLVAESIRKKMSRAAELEEIEIDDGGDIDNYDEIDDYLDEVDTEMSVNRIIRLPVAAVRHLPRFALAAAAAILVISGVLATLLGRGGAEYAGPIRIKGNNEASINIYRQIDSNAEELLADKSLVRENDLLQIEYISSGRPYGAVISLDGRGVVTVHYPYDTGVAGELLEGGKRALDYSYRLDDAPGFERFFFLTSDNQFNVAQVISAVRSLAGTPGGGLTGTLELPKDFEQYSVSLIKETDNE